MAGDKYTECTPDSQSGGGACCRCTENPFSSPGREIQRNQFYEGVKCYEGDTIDTVVVEPGYWRYSVRSAQMVNCSHYGQSELACKPPAATSTNASDPYCRRHHTGPLCR